MAKILALGATGSAILGFALIAAAAACAGYLGYKLVNRALGEEGKKGEAKSARQQSAKQQKAQTQANQAQTVSLDNL
jgi:hypothetical protein